jgi:hypothetical protein
MELRTRSGRKPIAAIVRRWSPNRINKRGGQIAGERPLRQSY